MVSPAGQRSRGTRVAAAVAIGLWALAELLGLLVSLFAALVITVVAEVLLLRGRPTGAPARRSESACPWRSPARGSSCS